MKIRINESENEMEKCETIELITDNKKIVNGFQK
jgi:hypothetical protein